MIQGKTSQVFITGNTVAKVFDRTQSKGYRGSGEQSYQREKECLKRLEGNIHFPEVIHFDDDNLTYFMSNHISNSAARDWIKEQLKGSE